ncbi:hypothetical protein [Rhodococcus sp. H29-C3]|uniref:hypothetical protein n=1 Tax=Rhodococcus sp. H29-C3 TaxID=3046307 RepID=UPI0024BB28CE|nr:hypothetical protein [Rhodococcus sp. H29-C3]MDJ0359701.1 hypothetical protein [Rhodococcus sp. H29-C3]
MTPPPIQVLAPGVVLLTGSAIPAARDLLAIARRARQRNGHPESRALEALSTALEIASATGQSDTDNNPETHDEPIEWLSTEQAADRMHCSTRNVRRRAPQLGGQLINGRWQLDAAAITEHIEGTTT